MACMCLSRLKGLRSAARLSMASINTARQVEQCCIISRNFSCGRTLKSHRALQNIPRKGLPFIPFSRLNGFQSSLLRGSRTDMLLVRQMGKASHSRSKNYLSEKHRSVAMYTLSIVILVCGGSYAAVPLYRLYCQSSGYGGTVQVAEVGEQVEKMEKQMQRPLTVKFNADKSASMQWSFKPRQSEIKIVPGETALAFYTAKNPTDQPITGVSTYNVVPFEAGQYFNKIQCFCFEEQRLNPGEEVDMPVFFYIDPEFVDDPSLRKVTELTLSYTFFEAKDGSWPDLGLPPGTVRHGSLAT